MKVSSLDDGLSLVLHLGVYEILKEAKIYFDDQKLLAEHINSIWDNHLDWWYSDKVQKAVNIFCNEFAYINKNKVSEIKKLLTNNYD